MLLLNLLKRWREGAIGGLLIACLLLLVQWKKADSELKQSRLAYENPATKESVHEASTAGPTLTIKRTWKAVVPKETAVPGTAVINKEAQWEDGPYAEKTETIEWAEGVSTTKTAEWTKSPVAIAGIGGNQNRWLLTGGLNRLSADFDGKMLLVGYGWANRFDLQAGAIRKDDKTSPWVTGTIRF